MKKVLVSALAGILVVALSAVAFAQQTQVNVYTVSGTISGSSGASSKKPKPISLRFNYTVDEQNDLRPALIRSYKIRFPGLRTNGAFFPRCTASALNNAKTDDGCPRGSKMGEGEILNEAGSPTDKAAKIPPGEPGQKSSCDARVEVYNAGKDRAALWISSGAANGTKCPLTVNEAIAAKYVRRGNDSSLEFDVPDSITTVAGLENSVISVGSSIRRATVRRSGKLRGYYESVGCRGGRGNISVTFVAKTGQSETASKRIRC